MKKSIVALLVSSMVLSLCACGGNSSSESPEVAETTDTAVSEPAVNSVEEDVDIADEEETAEDDSIVDFIDLSFEDGNVKFVGFERPDPKLEAEDPNAMIFVFDYTNYQKAPSMFQNSFYAEFYQNGIQLDDFISYSISSDGPKDQIELLEGFWNNAMQNGTIRFGQLVALKDESPVTILIRGNNGDNYDTYQMMEVSINEDGATNSTTDEANAGTQSDSIVETDNITIDGIYVDDSYKYGEYLANTSNGNVSYSSTSEDFFETAKSVYVFYTAHPNNQNLSIDAKSMVLTINDVNSYARTLESSEQVHFYRSYYSGYRKYSVPVGSSKKFVEAFLVPEGDLSAGRSISFSKDQIPGIEGIRLSTDDIIHCDGEEDIAQKADPEGYEKENDDLKDADSDLVSQVKNNLTAGTYFYDDILGKSSISFDSSNHFELTTSLYTKTGTYEVKKGYIMLKDDTSTNNSYEYIPYTFEGGDLNLDLEEMTTR